MIDDIKNIVEELDLKPHPEGGFYKETYRSSGVISKNSLPIKFSGDRNYYTAIYFLLTSDNFSAFHRIKQDEIWHYYQGDPLYVHIIDKDGRYVQQEIGLDFKNGAVPQFMVPAGCWFASSVKNKNSYSLVGCTVSPGFDFNDFELAQRDKLSETFPEHSIIIKKLTRI